ncbi:MAG TPA: thioredoxin domain-containing protein [Thermoplasmata archaeon]|nr:thioredoxin domain-containing protein [Thermoplasmata archaeon]
MPERTGPVRVNDLTFEAEVLRSPTPVVVDFYADWCLPCRATAPIVRDLSVRLAGRVKFATVDIDESAIVTRSYGIHSIPTYVFVQEGHEKGRTVGPIDPVAFRTILRRLFQPAEVPASGGTPASR